MAVGDLQWEIDKPAVSDSLSDIDGIYADNQTSLQRLFSKRINGCKMIYNSATSVDIGSGDVAISDGTNYRFRTNSAAITVTLSSADASSIYNVYVVADSSTNTSFTGEIIKKGSSPSGTYTRYVGSVATDSSSDIIQFWAWGKSNDRRVYYQDLADMTTQTVSALSAATWVDFDCSATVPTIGGAWAIWLNNNAASSTGTPTYQVRENGNTNNITTHFMNNSLKISTYTELEVPLDDDAIAERNISAENSNSWAVYVGGYRDFV